MTEKQAIAELAKILKISKKLALEYLRNAAEQLYQDDSEYTARDCFELAKDFYSGVSV